MTESMLVAARADASRLCVPFASEHIYNADEGPLFFRTLPRSTYSLSPVNGGELRKDRISFLVAQRMQLARSRT